MHESGLGLEFEALTRSRIYCKMAATTTGVQQLLAAEKKAAETVSEARRSNFTQ